MGYLDVTIPPDFIPEETSGDVMVPEGGTIKLRCRARGHPEPYVQWRREDGSDIIVKDATGQKMAGKNKLNILRTAIFYSLVIFFMLFIYLYRNGVSYKCILISK